MAISDTIHELRSQLYAQPGNISKPYWRINNYHYNRVDMQKKGYDILNGDYEQRVKDLMTYRYATLYDSYQNFIIPIMNPMKRIVELLSALYVTPPIREAMIPSTERQMLEIEVGDTSIVFEDDSEEEKAINKFFAEEVQRYNKTWKTAQGYYNGMRNTVMVPYYIPSTTKIRVRAFPPHNIAAKIAEDDDLDILCWWEDRQKYSAYIYDPQAGKRAIFWVDKDGETALPGKGIGAHIWLSPDDYHDKIFHIEKNSDMINGTIAIGEKESFEERADYLKSFNLLQQDPEDDEMILQRIDLGHILMGDVNQLKMVDNDTSYFEGIMKKAAVIAAFRNIPSIVFFHEIAGQQDPLLVDEEMTRYFIEQQQEFLAYEQQVNMAVLELGHRWGKVDFYEDLHIKVTYVNAHPAERDPKAELELFDLRKKQGLTNIITEVMKDPKIRSKHEAWMFLVNNLDITVKEYDMKARRNISNEFFNTKETASTPQQNGGAEENEERTVEEDLQNLQNKVNGQSGAQGNNFS